MLTPWSGSPCEIEKREETEERERGGKIQWKHLSWALMWSYFFPLLILSFPHLFSLQHTHTDPAHARMRTNTQAHPRTCIVWIHTHSHTDTHLAWSERDRCAKCTFGWSEWPKEFVGCVSGTRPCLHPPTARGRSVQAPGQNNDEDWTVTHIHHPTQTTQSTNPLVHWHTVHCSY